MKRYSFLLIFLLFLLFVPFIQAKIPAGENLQDSPLNNKGISYPESLRIKPLPPKQDTLPNMLGQDHQYSVILRGNGEAIVTGKMTFSNNTENDLITLDLEGPIGAPIDDLVVYQQERQSACLSYITPKPTYTESLECNQNTNVIDCDADIQINKSNCAWYYCVNKCLPRGTPTDTVCPQPVCEKYEDPDYFTSSSNTKNTYHKLKTNYRGNLVSIRLNKTVTPQTSGSIIFYYTQNRVAKKNLFGAYDFNFETLKVDDKIRNITVGISTDTDYFLKDTKGKVEYRKQISLSAIASKNMDLSAGVSSPQMDAYYNQIGSGQTYKTAANLQANESYKIKGTYADAQWKLYAGDTIRNIFFIILAIVILIFAIKVVMGKIFHGLKGIIASSGKKASQKQNTHPLILSVCLSFASSLIIIVSILVFIFLIKSSVFYGYSSYGTSNLLTPLILITVTIILLCVDLLALFLPTIFMWKKAGSTWGIVTFILNIMWFFFYLIATFLIVFLFSFSQYRQINLMNPPSVSLPTMKGID